MKPEIKELHDEINILKEQLKEALNYSNASYYFSNDAIQDWNSIKNVPQYGHPPQTVKTIIQNNHTLDFDQRLNTSSYVNVSFEKEEEEIAMMGLKINLADQTVYPQSYKLHDTVVSMIARLWHCPEPENDADAPEKDVNFAGAGTVGSTEACLLAGLALKFRWRAWYAKRHNLTDEEVLGVRPNLVISSCYQAAWEKLFRYMDIEPRLIQPDSESFTITPDQVAEQVDDKTIGVVCILGNHYGGQYDPVWEINKLIDYLNSENDLQLGIHVDAASGGFIAPFQKDLSAWDFRLNNVLSISASGHKYGESCCGTGWVVWRQRKDLSEHVAVSVTYLGGEADSYTLNFSRPASGVYVQYYKLLRYGMNGYQQCCDNLMENAKYIREGLKAMTLEDGTAKFVFLDNGDSHCLPVVTAMLNPECNFNYDDIHLQHALSLNHWYVSGYKMGFNHPLTEEFLPIFSDQSADQTMFRVVVKSNLTRDMADNLVKSFKDALDVLEHIDASSEVNKQIDLLLLRHKEQRKISNHC